MWRIRFTRATVRGGSAGYDLYGSQEDVRGSDADPVISSGGGIAVLL